MLTVIRVDDLIAKKDTEHSEGPVCDVCDGAQDPVTARACHALCPLRKVCLMPSISLRTRWGVMKKYALS
jgi:hypothetical protein